LVHGSEEQPRKMSRNGNWQNSHPGEAGQQCSWPGERTSDTLPISEPRGLAYDPLLTPEQVARRMNVSPDWVRDHSSRKIPRLPVIRLGGGAGRAWLLRYRASKIEEFIEEMERLSSRNSRRI